MSSDDTVFYAVLSELNRFPTARELAGFLGYKASVPFPRCEVWQEIWHLAYPSLFEKKEYAPVAFFKDQTAL